VLSEKRFEADDFNVRIDYKQEKTQQFM
jgi:hypothetical protein